MTRNESVAYYEETALLSSIFYFVNFQSSSHRYAALWSCRVGLCRAVAVANNVFHESLLYLSWTLQSRSGFGVECLVLRGGERMGPTMVILNPMACLVVTAGTTTDYASLYIYSPAPLRFEEMVILDPQ